MSEKLFIKKNILKPLNQIETNTKILPPISIVVKKENKNYAAKPILKSKNLQNDSIRLFGILEKIKSSVIEDNDFSNVSNINTASQELSSISNASQEFDGYKFNKTYNSFDIDF